MSARSVKARNSREGQRIALRFRQSAREIFPELADRLMASRPVLGEDKHGLPVYGKPTFRNRIDEETGKHV